MCGKPDTIFGSRYISVHTALYSVDRRWFALLSVALKFAGNTHIADNCQTMTEVARQWLGLPSTFEMHAKCVCVTRGNGSIIVLGVKIELSWRI